MSLQPGINPLEEIAKQRERHEMLRQIEANRFKQGMDENFEQNEMLRQKKAERIRTAMEFRHNMAQGLSNEPMATQMQANVKDRPVGVTGQRMENMGGFNPISLMSAPQLRQDATMNQANMVSSPYFEANEKAAEKINPMNAVSQNPGKVFLMKFIGK